MLKLFKIFIGILLVISCGKKGDLGSTKNSQSSLNPKPETSSDFLAFKKKFDKKNITCSRSGSCPENFVVLGVYNSISGEGDYCNGLVIEDEVVLTSSRCVKFRNIKDGDDCAELILVKGLDLPKSKICGYIKRVSLGNRLKENKNIGSTWNRDYVALKIPGLKRKGRGSLAIEKGIVAGRDFDLWSHELDTKKNEFSVRSWNCLVKNRTYLNPTSYSSYSPNRVVFCEDKKAETTISSPFLFHKRTKESHGLYYHAVEQSLIKELRSSKDLSFTESNHFTGYVMNFSCWDYINSSLPGECYEDLSVSALDQSRAILLDLELSDELNLKKIIDKIKAEYKEIDLFLKWSEKVDNVGFTYEVFPELQCFHKVNEWPEKLKRKFEYQIELNKYLIKPLVSAYYEVSSNLKIEKKLLFILKFNQKSVVKKGYSNIEVRLAERDRDGEIRYIYTKKIKDLNICAE